MLGNENIITSDIYFTDNKAHIQLYCVCGMYITGVVVPIKGFIGSRYFFPHNEGSLFHHVLTQRILSNTSPKDDIIFIG